MEEKAKRLKDPRRTPLVVLETLANLRDALEMAKKESAERGSPTRDIYMFQRIENWMRDEEAILQRNIARGM